MAVDGNETPEGIDDTKQMPRFHGLALKIFRMHERWEQAFVSRNRGLLSEWKRVLDAIHSELSPRMGKKRSDEYDKLLKNVIKFCSEYVGASSKRQGNPAKRQTAHDGAYTSLDLLEVFLRKEENIQGLDMKMTDKFDLGEGA